MKNNLRKWLAMLLTIIMVLSSSPLEALASIVEVSGSVNVSSLVRGVVPVDGVYVTYTFKNGDATVDTQIVKVGEGSVVEPATPTVAEGKRFEGWYAGDQKLTFGPVTGYTENTEITVNAKFSDVFYVYFMTQGGASVYRTEEATTANSYKVSVPTDYEPKNARVTAWKIKGTDTVFTADTVVTADTYVVPVTVDCYWVSFNAMGGSAVTSAYVDAGTTLTLSEKVSTRTGYSFSGWSATEGGTTALTAVTPADDVTLYAIWNPAQVDYTVVYWGENADDTNYSVLATAVLKATTGTALTLDKTTGVLPSGTTDSAYFTFKSSDTVTIAADGSSVLNVYYSRKTFKFTFQKKSQSGKNTSWTNFTTFERKYNSDISDIWSNTTITSVATSWSTSISGYNAQTLFIERMPGYNMTLRAYTYSGSTTYYWYYCLETVDGTTATAPSGKTTVTYGGKTYYIYNSSSLKSNGLSLTYDEDYFDITGFDQVDAKGANGWSLGNNSYYSKSFDDNNTIYLYYNRNSYSLIKNNYGVESSESIRYEASIADKGGTPTKPAGFSSAAVFKGWYEVEPEQVTVDTPVYDFTGKTMPAHNVVLYAYWQEPQINVGITITITNIGTFDQALVVPAGTTIAACSNYKDALAYIASNNKTLLKWVVVGTGELVNIYEPLYTNISITAVFVGDTYHVTYLPGNGTGTAPVDSNTYGPGSKAKAVESTLTAPSGYEFAYWLDEATGNQYYPGQYVTVVASDIALTAIYTPILPKATVVYHSNLSPDSTYSESNFIVNNTITIAAYSATGLASYTGYHFVNWNTNADGTGTAFAAGASARVDAADDTNHLYAIWAPNTDTKFVIEYYLESMTAGTYIKEETATENRTGTTGETYTVTDTDKKLFTGFTFDATNAQNVLSGVIAADGSLVLKLYYTRNSYEVTYQYTGTVPADATALPAKATYVYGAAVTVAAPATATGYTFSGWDKTDFTMPAEDVVISGSWTVNSYKVTYQYTGTVPADATALPAEATYDYGAAVTVAAPATATGYTFSGWNKTDFTMPAEDVVITGSWTVNSYAYTIHHVEKGNETNKLADDTTSSALYGAVIDVTAAAKEITGFTYDSDSGDITIAVTGNEATIYYSRNSYGYTIHHVEKGNETNSLADDTTGSALYGAVIDVTAAAKEITGFTYDSDSGDITIAVTGNEATIYYARNSYTLTITYVGPNDGVFVAPDTYKATLKYEDKYNVASPAVAGYTPDMMVVSGTMPADNVSVTVTYTANTDTAYKVEHYKANLDGTYNDKPNDTDNMTGTTGQLTEAAARNYEGFTAQAFDQVKIAGDGSTVVKIYYTRNSYDWTINHYEVGTTGPALEKADTGKALYGATIALADYHKTISGFTYDSQDADIVIGVSGNEANIYYSRNSYTLTITYVGPNDGVFVAPDTYKATLKYEDKYNVASPAVAGYTPDMMVVSGTMPAKDVSVTVTYTANKGTAYTVEHYKANLDGTYNETPDGTDNLTGTTGQLTEAAARNYEGFTAQAFDQVKIAGDGSTVVKIYYTRNSYTLYYHDGYTAVDGSTYTKVLNQTSYQYGETIGAAPADPTREGSGSEEYVFDGWNAAAPAAMPANDVHITAIWGGVKVDKTITSTPANGTEYVLNETIAYSVKVTNIGDVALTVALSDTLVSLTGDDASFTLAKGEDKTITYTHSVTATEINAEATQVVNTASATGTTENKNTVTASDTQNAPVAENDVPVISNPSVDGGNVTVYESALRDAATTAATGSFTVDFNTEGGVITVGTATITVAQDGTTAITGASVTGLYGMLNIDSAVSKDGVVTVSYTYTLSSKQTHDQPQNDAYLLDQFALAATDGSGDTANNTVVAKVVDDVPAITASIESAAIGSGTSVNGAANITWGADGAATTDSITVNGVSGTANGESLVFTLAYGTLTLAQNGSFTFKAFPNTGATQEIAFKVTDADGDTASDAVSVKIDMPIDPVYQASVTVYEEGLATGSEAASDSETAVWSAPDGYTLEAITTNGTKGTAVINENGTLSYTLAANLLVEGTGKNTVAQADYVIVTIQDANQNTHNVKIDVNVVDDIPSINAGADFTVISGHTANGNWTYAFGADVPASKTVNIGGETLNVPGEGTVTVYGPYGTWTFKADGTYTYQAKPNTSGNERIEFSITDADNDTASVILKVTVTPASLPDIQPGTVTSDDHDTTNNTYTFHQVYIDIPDGLSIDKTIALPQSEYGFYSYDSGVIYFTQLVPYLGHTQVNAYEETLVETSTFQAIDEYGNTKAFDVILYIVDDEPTATNDTATVSEDSTTTITGNVLTNDTLGADLKANDDHSGSVAWAGTASYGTFTPKDDGTYAYVLDTTNPSVQALNEGDTLTETMTYTYSDRDATPDTATATLTITITGVTDQTSVTVHKVWIDEKNAYNTRKALNFALYHENDTTAVKTAELPESDLASEDWSTVIQNVDQHDGTAKYVFTLAETDVPVGYTANVVKNNEYEFTVTNTLNSYQLTIKYIYANGTTAATTYTETLLYNQPYEVTSPAILGYTPDIAIVSGNMPAEDKTVTVTYSANSDTKYTVEFFYQILNADGTLSYPATAGETLVRTGTTDTTVSVTEADKADKQNGKYVYDTAAANVESGSVEADDSLTLKLYFKLNQSAYTIHHYLDGTTVSVGADQTGIKTVSETLTATPYAAKDLYNDYQQATVSRYSPTENSVTIQVNPALNVITVYYKVPLTITAESAEKTYDGKALTQPDFKTDGLVNGDTKAMFAASMTADSTITNAGTQANKIDETTVKYNNAAIPSYYTVTYAEGLLTINPLTTVVVTITGHTDTQTYDGKEHEVTGYDVEINNPLYTVADFTFSGDATAKRTEVGTTDMGLKVGDFANNNTNFSNVTFVVTDGWMKILPLDTVVVTITGHTDTQTYDGAEHEVTGYDVDINNPLYTEDDFTFSGSAKAVRTIVGKTYMGLVGTADANEEHRCQFTNINANFSDVIFVVTDGWININPITELINLTADSNSKIYDGTALTDNGYTAAFPASQVSGTWNSNGYYDLSTGDKLYATVEGTITNVGSAGNQITSYQVLDGNGTSTTDYYSFGTVVNGTLTITPKAVTVTAASEAFKYDGAAHTNANYTVTGLVGEDAISAVVTGSITYVSESPVTNKLTSYAFTTGTASNYAVTTADGALTMSYDTAVAITLTADSDSWTYDGNAHTLDSYELSIESGTAIAIGADGTYTFENGDVLTAVVEGTITNVAESDVDNEITSYTIMNGTEDVSTAYAVTTANGALTITPKAVTVTAASEAFKYDGAAHTNANYTVEGLVGEDAISAVVTGSITYVSESPVTNKLTSYAFTAGTPSNYAVTTADGTLTMSYDTAVAITLTADSDSWTYDGNAHTLDSYQLSIEGGTAIAIGADGTYTFENGDVLTAVVEGTITNVAESDVDNEITSYTIMNGTENVAEAYAVTTTDGALTITARPVTITVDPAQKAYAEPHNADPTFTGTVEAQNDTTKTGVVTGEDLNVAFYRSNTDEMVGEYPNVLTASYDTTNTNYTVTVVPAKFTITGDPFIPVKDSPAVTSNYKLGDAIPFTITVRNVSNYVLTNVTVKDNAATLIAGTGYNLTDAHNATIPTIAIGTSVIVSAQHIVTSDDILAGTYGNTANVKYGDTVIDADKKIDDIVPPDVTLDLVKTSDVTEPAVLDQTITYTVTVTNNGNVPYPNMVISDDKANLVIDSDSISGTNLSNVTFAFNSTTNTITMDVLPVGASLSFTATYKVVEADILTGTVSNTANAKGDAIKDPTSDPANPTYLTPEAQDTVTDETEAIKDGVTIVKACVNADEATGLSGAFRYGDTARYTITVANTGNVTLHNNVIVTELLDGAIIDTGAGYTVNSTGNAVIDSLNIGQSVVIYAHYEIKTTDIQVDPSKLTNKASTAYQVPTGPDTLEDKTQDSNPVDIDVQGKVPVTITAVDNTWSYDGIEKTEPSFQAAVTDKLLANGAAQSAGTTEQSVTLNNNDVIKAAMGDDSATTDETESKITNPGTVVNHITTWSIMQGTKDMSANYTVTVVDGNISVTQNYYKLVVNKAWDRPADVTDGYPEITFVLEQNGVEFQRETLAYTDTDTFVTFANLPVAVPHPGTGMYEYSVFEEAVNGYLSSVTNAGTTTVTDGVVTYQSAEAGYDSTEVIFTNQMQTTAITGTKAWTLIEGQETVPDVTIELYRSDDATTPYRTAIVKGGTEAEREADYEFTDLPTYAPDGTAYTYDVKEAEQPGYTPAYENTNETDGVPVVQITNVQKAHTYKVEYYQQQILNNLPVVDGYDLIDLETMLYENQGYGWDATYVKKDFDGFYYEKTMIVEEGVERPYVEGAEIVPDNDDMIVRVYYTRRTDLTYTIDYRKVLPDGTVDQTAGGKLYGSKVVEDCVFGAKYDEQAKPDKDGYSCDDPQYTIEITTGHNGYTFKYVLRVIYSVYYYYDGVFDADQTYYSTGRVGATITTYVGKAGTYRLDRVEGLPLVLSENGENIIRVYYIKTTPIDPPVIPLGSGSVSLNVGDCFE